MPERDMSESHPHTKRRPARVHRGAHRTRPREAAAHAVTPEVAANAHQEDPRATSILGLLGLAIRAHQVRGGATASEAMLRSGAARLVLLARDSAPGTKRAFGRLAQRYGVPLIEQHTQEEYGVCFHGAPRAVMVIVNRHFAAGMLKKTGQQTPRTKTTH